MGTLGKVNVLTTMKYKVSIAGSFVVVVCFLFLTGSYNMLIPQLSEGSSVKGQDTVI